MTKQIGTTLQKEFLDAGITAVVIDQTVRVQRPMTPTELDAFIAVWNAHDPNKRVFTPLSRMQFSLSLIDNGLSLDTIIQTLTSLGQTRAVIMLQSAGTFERDNPMVTAMLPILGKTPAEADAIWVHGATL